MDWFHVEK
jgi:hypothetical protein